MSTVGLRLGLAAFALLMLAGAGWKCHLEGRRSGAAEVRAQWEAQAIAIERVAHERASENQRVITKVVTRFVEKAAQERVIVRDQIREVENYVPSTLPVLPGDFRVFHDAAATGLPLPGADDPGRAGAATVKSETVAVTVAENYAGCREDRRRLEALQEIVAKIYIR